MPGAAALRHWSCLCLCALALLTGGAPAQGQESAAQTAVDPQAIVIELLIDARDSIPITATQKVVGGGRRLAVLSEGALFLDPAVFSPSKPPELAEDLRFDESIADLSDIAVVVLEQRAFLGRMRHGGAVRLWAARDLPPFPVSEPPESVIITPFGAEPPLPDLVAWPSAVWSLAEDAAEDSVPLLKIEAEEGPSELRPGEELTFRPEEWVLPITLGRFAPAKVGEPDQPLVPIEQALGNAAFSSVLTVKFHGRLPLRVAP